MYLKDYNQLKKKKEENKLNIVGASFDSLIPTYISERLSLPNCSWAARDPAGNSLTSAVQFRGTAVVDLPPPGCVVISLQLREPL